MENIISKLPWLDYTVLIRKHPQIYHYTNFHTLRAILQSDGLLASPFMDTNDNKEFSYAADIICPLIENYARNHWLKKKPGILVDIMNAGENPEYVLRHESRAFYNAGMKTWESPCITCFSTHQKKHHMENGLLTMWRSYCRENGGIALGFSTRKLVECTHQLRAKYKLVTLPLLEVVYGDQERELQKRVRESEDLISAYTKFADSILEDTEFEFSEYDVLKLFVFTVTTKHPDFSDEREVRLVATRYRGINDPRAEIPTVGDKLILEISNCITHILIGPSQDQKAVMAAVKDTLHDFGRSDIRVSRSKTPFRSL